MMDQSEKNIHYAKPIGAYRPAFEGKPETYYTLSNFDVCCGLFACFGVIFVAFGLSVGLYFWSHDVSTDNLVTVWSIVLIIFVPFFMITAFCFSRGKAEIEQELIRKALEKQMHKKEVKSEESVKQKKDEFEMLHREVTTFTALQK